MSPAVQLFRSRTSIVTVLLVGLTLALQSCLFTRSEKKEEPPDPELLKPQVAMSEDYIRSKPGDLLAFMPKGWFLIDVEGKVSSDIVAVAVNNDYTLSMVIQTLRSNDLVRQTVSKEGLIGLARIAFEKRSRKTANSVRLMNAIDKQDFGLRTFGYYEFSTDSTDSTAARARSVVLVSSSDNYYEVSLVPTTITTAKLPEESEMKKIFHSIVVMLQY